MPFMPQTADIIGLVVVPLSHMFERTGGYHLPMTAGPPSPSLDRPNNWRKTFDHLKPTVIFERVCAEVQDRLQVQSPTVRKLLNLAGDETRTDSRFPDLVFSWESWRPPHQCFSLKEGMDDTATRRQPLIFCRAIRGSFPPICRMSQRRRTSSRA
jgi:hypothetical protein